MQPQTLLQAAEQEVFQRLKKPARPYQIEVIAALAEGKNVFAALPTGYGKSLCYWAPAAAWRWKVWVISPLVSLIQDQAMACEALGLKVAAWHGPLGAEERARLEAQMESAQICFLSPERLAGWWESGYLDRLDALGYAPQLIALDEMHCFQDWRGFRSGYRHSFAPLNRLSQRGVLILGLSATLSRAEAGAWMSEFCSSHVFLGSGLGRERLSLRVLPMVNEGERWLAIVSALRELKEGESALVYCATREECDELSRWLNSAGIRSCAYHAGLANTLRKVRSRAFRRGDLPVVCATTAFGMGVDYGGVRRVIHFSLPRGLDAYWQEAGRAGRDGEPAYALAFWRRSEITRARAMSQEEKIKFFHLWKGWASGECRRMVVARSLGIEEERCGVCDRCAHLNGGAGALPGWLWWPDGYSIKARTWWTEPEANLTGWAQEKILGDNLDA